MHLQQKRGWSPRSCVLAAMCSGYAGHYRNHLTAGSLAALKRDFNITEIEGVSTRIITEALASAVKQSAYVWYARESLNAVGDPQGRRPNKRPRFKASSAVGSSKPRSGYGAARQAQHPRQNKSERLRRSGARASVRTHKRGLWPNVRSWGEPDMPGWRE